MFQMRAALRKFIAPVALAIGLVVMVSGCEVAAALRHEDEVAQSVEGAEAGSSGGAAASEPTGNQHWTSSETNVDQCNDDAKTLTGIRVGRHEGFDRVVFDLSGEGAPCYRIFFDDNPVQDGSGFPVEMGDFQALRVEINRLGPDFPTIMPGYSAQLGGPAVDGAFFDTFFEGVATNFIAVAPESAGPRVYAVSVQPGQLIVDVAPLTE